MKFISPIVSDARASVGGSTFSKNRGGNYIRARVAPVQPRSTYQQASRAALATLSANWKALTASQRAAWAALAAGITLKDSLGTAYVPTGSQLYVGLNRVLGILGISPISAAPAGTPSYPDMLPIAATATAGTPSLAVTTSLGSAPTGFTFLLRASAQGSAGISFFGSSAYRVIGNYASSAYASINALAAYNARFGALVAGTKIALQLSLVQTATGFESVVASTTVIVAA